jgi:hypothetical protein
MRPQDRGFLKARISSTVFSIYECAAAEAQHVGRAHQTHILPIVV